ncbi:hypothetical protein D3C85_1718570 [compost metagenome]
MDRHILRQAFQHVAQRLQPFLRDQDRCRRATRRPRSQHAQHHLPFRHEQTLAAGQVALLHISKGGNSKISGIGNGDQIHVRPSSAPLGINFGVFCNLPVA